MNILRYRDDSTLAAETEEELKSLLMKVEEGSVKKLAQSSTFRKLRSRHLAPPLHGCTLEWNEAEKPANLVSPHSP